MAVNSCEICLEKHIRIDELEEEARFLRAKVRNQARKDEDDFFGSSTPSSNKPVKPDTEQREKKPGGTKSGQKGIVLKRYKDKTSDRMVEVEPDSETCPDCGAEPEENGWTDRSVIDTPNKKAEKITYRLAKRYCPRCSNNVTPQPPGVFPRRLSAINSLQILPKCTICMVCLWEGSANI